jgi:Papain family cysteine protease
MTLNRPRVRCLPSSVLAVMAVLGAALWARDSTTTVDSPSRLPEVVELLKYQTRIRNQGRRGVCPYFAPVAALEAAYRRAGEAVELSEEHLTWLRNVTACADSGNRDIAENLLSTLGGGNGMGVLNAYAICRAQDLPYRENVDQRGFGVEKYDWSKPFNQFLLNRWNFDPAQLTPAARMNARYAIANYTDMPAEDLKSPGKFEEILASGREIVFTLMLHDDIYQVDPAKPVWRRKAGTRPLGNHFMLMVGYDSRRRFFIVKNQWGAIDYTAQKARLGPGWEDIVRYDGYTLVDYGYLSECGEGHWITGVVPVESRQFDLQRALGLWAVTFTHKNGPQMKGVLCWRRLPNDATGKLAIPLINDEHPTASPTWTPPAHLKWKANRPNWRIGDLLTADGQEIRVNAVPSGDSITHYDLSLYIDLTTGAIPTDSKEGAAWKGSLKLPSDGSGSMSLNPAGASSQELWGVPASEWRITAELVGDRNLLKDVAPPKSVTVENLVERKGGN